MVEIVKEHREKIKYNRWDENTSLNIEAWVKKVRKLGGFLKRLIILTSGTNAYGSRLAVANILKVKITDIEEEVEKEEMFENFESLLIEHCSGRIKKGKEDEVKFSTNHQRNYSSRGKVK